ncbi:MAG: protein translocase subunit SecF [Acidobacteriota bacterium]
MIQVFHNTNFQMMGRTKYFFMAFSMLALTVAFGSMAIRGFNFGIDFAGGTAVQIRFRETPRVEDLRARLEAANLGDINIQQIGSAEDNEVLVRVEQQRVKGAEEGSEGGEISQEILLTLRSSAVGTESEGRLDLNLVSETRLREWLEESPGTEDGPGIGPEIAAAAAASVIQARIESGGLFRHESEIDAIAGLDPASVARLREATYLGPFVLRGIDFVGPTAGKELIWNTVLAISASVVLILAWIWFRFHRAVWGVAAILALIHDVAISAGAMSLTGKEFSLPVVAALLTILGYSINDTIVIFDRIRENLRLFRDHDFEKVVNASINQTLSRSVLTSFTAFIAVTALFLYGGDKLNPLSFCLMVGVVFGTYSSIFVAGGALVLAHRYLGARHVRA